jgi:hypothetical protein
MNNLFKLIGAAALAAILINPTLLAADPGSPPASTQRSTKASARPYPFRGVVDSIDAQAGTLSLDGKKSNRVLEVNSETVLEKDGKPARLDEVQPGDYARGLVSRMEGGREVMVKATFGPKPDSKPAKKKASLNPRADRQMAALSIRD